MQAALKISRAAATTAISVACLFVSLPALAQVFSAPNSVARVAKSSAQGGGAQSGGARSGQTSGAQSGQTSGAKGGAKGGANGGAKGGAKGGSGGPPNGGGPETRTTSPATGKDPAIQWYATLERGLAEAKRTNKPILFVTGAPHCSGVSGMWCPGKKKIDDGWLTHNDIIEVAQKFVCIRLTSYESQSEAHKFLRHFNNVVVRQPAIVNFLFTWTPHARHARAMRRARDKQNWLVGSLGLRKHMQLQCNA